MTKPYLSQIWLNDLDARDLNCLQIAVNTSIFGHKVEHILASVSDFSSQLWRGEVQGKRFIIVTQMFDHPGGRELRIWAVGGSGYVKGLDIAYKELESWAKEHKCRWISGQFKRSVFARLYSRFNFKDVYRNCIVEV